MNTLLNSIYRDYSNPGGLGSINALYREARKRNKNITLRDVKSFMENNRTYTLHKVSKKKFPRRKILAPKPLVILSCDLADFSHLQRYNKGFRYIMVCLDVFSRYLQVVPLKRKSALSSTHAMRIILESDQSKGYSRLYTDLGSEFYNSDLRKYLSQKRIKL